MASKESRPLQEFDPVSFEPVDVAPSNKAISRRQFFGLGVATTVSTLVEIDHDVKQRLWPPTKTRVEVVNYGDLSKGHQDEAWLVVPGTGVMYGEDTARLLADQPEVDASKPVASVVFSNQGLRLEDQTNAVANFIEDFKIRILHLLTQSGGGKNGVITVSNAQRLVGAPLELGGFMLNCAPFKWGNVRDNAIMGNMLDTPLLGDALDTIYAKWLGIYIRNVLQEGPSSLLSSISKADHGTVTGCSPDLWTSMVRILKDTDVNDYDTSNVISQRTQPLYCMPKRSSADPIVYNPDAAHDWNQYFRKHRTDLDINRLRVRGECHANNTLAIKGSRSWLGHITQAYSPVR